MEAFLKIQNKIKPIEAAVLSINTARENNKKIVFTNGCFDLLHLGHLDYLAKAKDLGDYLVIGLNSSESVQRLKGPSRPINDTKSRAHMLAALEFVDLVVVFNEDTPIDLINHFKPDTLVKGGDYTIETIVGAEEVISQGGKVQVIPFLEGYSSTNIVTKIQRFSKS